MKCPIQTEEDWINLVNEYGSAKATDIFIENEGEVPKGVANLINGEIKSESEGRGNDVPSTSLEEDAYYKANQGQLNLTRDHVGWDNKTYNVASSESVKITEQFLHDKEIIEFKSDGLNEKAVVSEKANMGLVIRNLFKELTKRDRHEVAEGQKITQEYSKNILEADLEFAENWANEAKEEDLNKLLDYVEAIKLNDMDKLYSLKIDLQEKKVFDTILKANIRLNKIVKGTDVIYDGDGKAYSSSQVGEENAVKITNQLSVREKALNKYPRLKPALLKIEKWMHKMDNARLVSKYLTGSDKSNLANVFWKSFYKASGKMYKLQNDFISEVRITSKESLKKMSLYNNPKARIDEMDYKEIAFTIGKHNKYTGELKNAKSENVKLSPAELISLYLNLRNQKGDETDPRHAMVEQNNGFFLRDNLNERSDDRRIHLGTTVENRKAKAKEIADLVESNEEYMELIKKIDSALKKRHYDVNKPYSQLIGWNLEEINNFFPSRYGQKEEHVKTSHMSVQKLGNIIERSKTKDMAIQIGDVFEVLDSYNLSTSHYSAYALPVHNANKVLKQTENNLDEYSKKEMKFLLNKLRTFVAHNEDPAQLFKSEGDSQINKLWNKFNNTFALSVLGWNVPVMMKQTASYQLAKESINGKYLNKAGWGIGGSFVGIKPKFIWDSLLIGKKVDGSLIPISWRADESNPLYKEIMENSDILSSRFGGMIDREMGEFAMGSKFGNDKLRAKIGNKSIEIDKQRFMEGIKMFDTATVIAIWEAAKFETLDQTDLAEGSPEFMARVRERTEEIVAKTQPTFDNANRMELALSRDPVMRMFTMFTSATSKMGQLNMEGALDFINEPTTENKKKMFKRMMNTTVGVGTWIAAINILYGGTMALLGGDDEKFDKKVSGSNYIYELMKTSFSQFPFARELFSGISSRLDKEFWKDDMSVPALEYVNKMQDGIGYGGEFLINGKVKDGMRLYNTSLEVFAQGTGLPMFVANRIKLDTSQK